MKDRFNSSSVMSGKATCKRASTINLRCRPDELSRRRAVSRQQRLELLELLHVDPAAAIRVIRFEKLLAEAFTFDSLALEAAPGRSVRHFHDNAPYTVEC